MSPTTTTTAPSNCSYDTREQNSLGVPPCEHTCGDVFGGVYVYTGSWKKFRIVADGEYDVTIDTCASTFGTGMYFQPLNVIAGATVDYMGCPGGRGALQTTPYWPDLAENKNLDISVYSAWGGGGTWNVTLTCTNRTR